MHSLLYHSPVDHHDQERWSTYGGELQTTLEAEFGDPGVNDAVWTGEMDWGDGSSGPTTSSSAVGSAGAGASGSIGASHTYETPGVYAVGVTVRDKASRR